MEHDFGMVDQPPRRMLTSLAHHHEHDMAASPGELSPAAALRVVERQCVLLLGAPSGVYQCPITRELFKDPVMAKDGHTYERRAIQEHFRRNSTRSPMTNETLCSDALVDNLFCRMAVQEFRDASLRGISEMLPFVDEIGDKDCAEALLSRAEECATSPEAACAFRAKWLRGQIARAGAGHYLAAADKLRDLIGLDIAAASAAVAEIRSEALVRMCGSISADTSASAFVAHERLKRVTEQAMGAFLELLGDEQVEVKGTRHLTLAMQTATEQVRSGLNELEEKTGMVVFSEINSLFAEQREEEVW